MKFNDHFFRLQFGVVFTLFFFVIQLQAQPGQLFPLAQMEDDNRHPNFNESETFHSKSVKHWLAWDSGTEINKNIYVKYSLDDTLWSAPIAITSDNLLNQHPQIELLRDSVLIVWETQQAGVFQLRYFFGDIQNAPVVTTKLLTEELYRQYRPVLRIFRQNEIEYAMVVWEGREHLHWSLFDGQEWSEPGTIATNLETDQNPSLYTDNPFELPVIAWAGLMENNWDIYSSWFLPDSGKWMPPLRLTTDPAVDQFPAVGQAFVSYLPQFGVNYASGWLTWQTNREGNWQIYEGVFYSSDEPPLRYGNLSSNENDNIHPAGRQAFDIDVIFPVFAWQSGKSNQSDIYSTLYFFGFLNNGYITNDTLNQVNPVFSAGVKYWIAWETYINGHWEIWGTQAENRRDWALGVPQLTTIPSAFELSQNYPNPFNANTVFHYTLATGSKVTLEIYNLRGQKIKTLVQGVQSAGAHQITWWGDDATNLPAASGIYLCVLACGSQKQTKKAILIR